MDDRSFHSARIGTLCAGVTLFLATGWCAPAARAAATEAQPSTPDSPTAPTVHLVPIGDWADDIAFRADSAQRAADLQRRADRQKNALRRIRLRQAAINIILAEELEPACSSLLLHGLLTDRDIASAVEALDRADGMLAQCALDMDAMSPGSDEDADQHEDHAVADGKDEVAEPAPEQRQKILVAFARGLRALMVPGEESDNRPNPRRAASQLSFLLEHEDPQVAAAATLWQACLRAREDDSGPAQSIVGSPLADPLPGSMPYAFFGSLLRCRLVARDGGYAASLALLAQLEDVSADWFDEPAGQANALRAVSLVEIETLIAWHQHLSHVDQETERQWCADRVDRLRKERFASDGVLRLRHAIPIMCPEARPTNQVP